ncbi:trimethylamine--corrinoid methyltransferase [Sinorhizobium meliloti]|uniref:trimethylamine methyltransferase family protein n=1 Tax=Rhizobium meliloti TaxID=382 RepID=UPI000FDBE063|nr:trimethylamine methyltransferase family protein [Sinorhizobium meliloti]MDW9373585.1 trimethylamine--corrinoid methyltransferase [Sinorhizobium meliloti]MDW9494602.1 trimethylamine--corrinoid methyltransferase [Sinorhizobium meliloti]MDW9520078.1 trimethylamine--corrinoid methyltransferase [Sinorhizobium meliloti]MDW9562530.1 trimethylamine--corrinoid methyltransferase [Sinorhizobium meliloti]MDW9647099.1 trimethylamine--corrinoid methyltransferase [Sinorhizobium meliloti]
MLGLQSISSSDLGSALTGHGIITVDESALGQIEAGADRVLEEVGIRFEDDPETLDLWREHGGIIKGDRVFLEGSRLRQIIRGSAPQSFVLRGRNPDRDTGIGAGQPAAIAPIYGAPNVLLPNGRRAAGSLEIYRRLVSMAHAAPAISNTGHMICVLNDVAEADRPMEMALAHLTLSDKPFMGTIASPEAAEQVIDAVSMAVGREPKAGECELLHLINATPPLTYKENPLKCLRAIAQRRQACMVTSYMMMGATSPVTGAGTLIQGYTEVLAGLALAQLWSPGAPVVMGLFGIPFDMRSMLPCYGDPASHLVQIYAVQLARRLGPPVRGEGGVTSAKMDDGQAGSEGARATAASLLSGADFILHGAGWLEQGRCVSIGKFKREAKAIAESYGFGTDQSALPLPFDPRLEADLRRRLRG